jgi:hypothetical protein
MPGEDEVMDARRMVAEAIADYAAAARDLDRWACKFARDHPSLRWHKPADPEHKPEPEPKLDKKPDPMAPVRKLYDFLASTPPFNGWNLPDAHRIEFRLLDNVDDRVGYYDFNGRHIIAIKSRLFGQTQELTETLAHELCHLHQFRNKKQGIHDKAQWHNATFQALARQVRAAHGFDVGVPIGEEADAEIAHLPRWPRSKRHVA